MSTLQEATPSTRDPETSLRDPIAYIPWVMLAAAAGAIVFVATQILAGLPLHIAEFMGAQIVRKGGYHTSLAALIGWGVHLGVALAYAALYALIVDMPGFPTTPRGRRVLAGLVAVGLGWITTMIAPPAIAVTIGALAGRGIPDSLPGLNTTVGIPLWTHLAFFASCWFVLLIARSLWTSRT